MKRSVHLLWEFALLASACAASTADPYSTRRADARTVIERIDHSLLWWHGSTLMLFSMAEEISISDLVRLTKASQVTVTGVYLCAEGGGALGIDIDPAKDLSDELERAERRVPQEALAIARSIAATGVAGSAVGPVFRTSSAYCGFEAKGPWRSLRQLRLALGARLYMVELTSQRWRMLPANVVR